MTEVKVVDAAGKSMTLLDAAGRYLLPGTDLTEWTANSKFEVRDDDVFICSSPKSGFHWIWEITRMLRAGNAEYSEDVMESNMVDFMPQSLTNRKPSPRTFPTHRYPIELPSQLFQKQCKIIYLLRDPRDTCVSYYNHLYLQKAFEYEGEFNDFVPLFLDGKVPFNTWTEHTKRWSEFRDESPLYPFLVMHYEDVKKAPFAEVERLAAFLDVNATDQLISDICRNTSFEQMKQTKENMPNPFLHCFKHGKEIMYRKGGVSDWKNWFNNTRLRELETEIKSRLQNTKYTSLMSPDRYFSAE